MSGRSTSGKPLFLTPEDAFQPDLVVVTDPVLVTARASEGPPALIVEILSESTVTYDRLTKSRRYAALGVPHFWIVDIANTTLECYRNQHGSYVPGDPRQRRGDIRTPGFPPASP
jgi:Uma2 family endonuclease